MQIKTDTGIIDSTVFIPKFDAIISRGLSYGLGKQKGQMCIEAAVCAALDLPHSDDPQCVSAAVRSFKIRLNDSNWSSGVARAEGLRDLGIAQLGSKGVVDDSQFTHLLTEKTIRRLIPTLFREIFQDNPACLTAADTCEQLGTTEAARAAADAAARDARDARDARYAADAAYAAAAYANTAYTAAAEYAVAVARSDKYLILSADLALEVLTELGSPGVAWL